MSKQTIADTLTGIAQLLDLKGENPFKIRAYIAGARAVEMYPGDLDAAVRNGELGRIEGIGDALAKKITELVTTGRLQFYEDLKAGFPPTIFELFEISGLGAKKIKALYEQLGVASIAQLDAACREERVAKLPGFGEKTARNLLAAVAHRLRNADFYRLGDVAAPTLRLAEELRGMPAVLRASEAGSFRRRKEIVRDLDFVASTQDPAAVAEFFVTRPEVAEIIARGPTKVSVRLQSGVQCDLRLVTDQEYPYALHHFTGSKEHNIALRQRALERGWSINEYRFSAAPAAEGEGKGAAEPLPLPVIRDEPEFYGALGLGYIPPELREGLGEIEAAEQGTLPELIALENLRGTFHCHTHASDGRHSLEDMAAAAQDLGLDYLGIADHSKSSIQANGQDEQRLAAQVGQIRELNAKYAGEGSRFRLFAGVECDVLKDGTLDFSDEVLASLDYVVVSVHNSFNQAPEEMTRRLIRAMENPHVTILGHLTGRMLLIREGYAVDVPAILDAAAATGTIIELNGNPRRLDMDWRWWRRAKEKGVRCAIDPDAHSRENLQHLWFGVTQARKGWLTRADVVNCAPLGEIEGILQAKKSRAGL
jgi:DNA polymerase (family 10)